MAVRDILMSASGTGTDKLYVDDVFSTWLRTGTGADVTTTNNIDMTKGYMLWSKGRSGATDHAIYDSARGVTLDLVSNSTAAQTTQTTGLKSVSTNGYTIGSLAKMNTSSATYVDWVFRKAPKFFDVVTYTGSGVAGRTVAHSLGSTPGCIIVKRTDAVDGWQVYHRSLGAGYYIRLNETSASAPTTSYWNSTEPTNAVFTLGDAGGTNANGATYVAYLFAHDVSADGIIQAGSYVGNGSAAGPTVTLGWEPQWLLIKRVDSSTGGNWAIYDVMRKLDASGGNAAQLYPNLSVVEDGGSPNAALRPTATGFQITDAATSVNANGGTYIYLAIRRQNKPPTTGTQVYEPVAYTGNTAARTVGTLTADLAILSQREGSDKHQFTDRLRGSQVVLNSTGIGTESTVGNYPTFGQNGFNYTGIYWNNTGENRILNLFRRAPGFFDVVCYTGTGVARTVNHNLGAVPELMIVKVRTGGSFDWSVYHKNVSITPNFYELVLNTTAATATSGTTNSPFAAAPTLTTFSLPSGTASASNRSTWTYVAYLFASLPGISKVFSYTGNGTSQTINCGFSSGARFILIKRTDNTGNWVVADSARGIVSANDPALYLNSTSAEVTTADWVDPDNSGFVVIQESTMNVNANGATYIGLAIS